MFSELDVFFDFSQNHYITAESNIGHMLLSGRRKLHECAL